MNLACARIRGWSIVMITAVGLALSSCGGGGGDAPPAPLPSGPVTITGTASFESVPNNNTNGALNYAAATFKPIRGATVQLIDAAGATLASGTTSDTGAYSLGPMTVTGPIRVRVRAELKRTAATGGSWDVVVRDNTSGNALYALDSPAFTPAGTLETRNVQAGSGWGGTGYTGVRAAGPFAVLDTVWGSMQKVLGVSPNANFAPLSIYWSVNNRPASGGGGIAAGNIGTSFFTGFGGNRALYLLGAENVDTDEYDTHVVAHEWGHYFESAFSRSDSVGGPHSGGDRLDMRVAFSEGWGNAWSGMALGSPRYADSGQALQGTGFVIDVSVRPANNRGWYSEDSVQYLLWSWHEGASLGFAPIFSALTGPLRTSSVLVAIHHFAAELKAAAPAGATAVNTLLADQLIDSADALGSNETNDGGVPLALPVYNTWAGSATLYCVSTAAGTPNKLGLFKAVRFTTVAAGSRTITVTASAPPTSTDPDFTLVRSDGSTAEAEGGVVNSETLTTNLPAGTHTLVLSDFSLRSGTSSGQRCFTVNVL